MERTKYNSDKMYTYLRGYCSGKGMKQAICALGFARKKHNGQFRKSGEPYIVHPLTMACNALSLGICEDEVIATILLHDVVEDCGVSLDELPVNDTVRRAVDLMTFKVMDGETKESAKVRYYNLIPSSREAVLTKLIDRCHNVSSMAGTFSIEKLRSYIEETRTYVLPLLRKAKDAYPEYSDALFALKYHIVSVVDAIDCTMDAYERKNEAPAEKSGSTDSFIIDFKHKDVISVLKYLHDHPDEDIKMGKWQKEFGLGVGRVSRIFRLLSGEGIISDGKKYKMKIGKDGKKHREYLPDRLLVTPEELEKYF